MSKALKVIAVVAAVVAVAIVLPGVAAAVGITAATAATIASVATAVSVAASLGAAALQKRPGLSGSISQVLIGATLPIPLALGTTYVGGMQVYDNSGGPAPNTRRWQINVVSAAGPIEQFVSFQADYSTVSFAGDAAQGWYDNYLFKWEQLGARPETAYTDEHVMPGWGAQHKLSGYASYKVKMKYDEDGKRFASGVPQFGVIVKGVKVYDPRLDSTYPGGVGTQRWNDEATWAWSDNPALHALAYARGRFIEKDASGAPLATPVKIAGVGIPIDAVEMSSFVELANLCDANAWKVGGSIYEAPGLSKWDNLKRILQAGGAKPVWARGMLRLHVSAPRTSLFRITADDLAEGPMKVRAMRGFRDRNNSVVPKYRDPDAKWEYVQGAAVTSATYLAEDGELKTEEVQFDLVQNKDQAAQLAAYELVNAREFGPMTVTVKPLLLAYQLGEAGTVHIPEAGLVEQLAVITGRQVNPATGAITLTLESETAAKHAYALGQTGTAPPTPVIRTSQEMDETAAARGQSETTQLIKTSYPSGMAFTVDSLGAVAIGAHSRVYDDKQVAVNSGSVTVSTGAAGDMMAVYYDDPPRAGGPVTYGAIRVAPSGSVAAALTSPANPFRHFVGSREVPASGTASGGGGGGGYVPPAGGPYP